MKDKILDYFSDFSSTCFDPTYYARAMGRYLEGKRSDMQSLLNMLSSIDYDTDDEQQEGLYNYIYRVLDEYGYNPDALIFAGSSYVSLINLISVMIAVENDTEGLNYVCTGLDAAGNDVFGLPNPTPSEVIRYLYESMYNTAGMAACLENIRDNLVESVTSFKSSITEKIGPGHEQLSAYYERILQSSSDPAELINLVLQNTGVNAAAAVTEDNPFLNADTFDVSQYTGSAPVATIDFSGVKGVVSTVANVGSKLLAGIGGLIAKTVSKVASKAVAVVNEICINPQDLVTINVSDPNRTVNMGAYRCSIPDTLPDLSVYIADPEGFDNRYTNSSVGVSSLASDMAPITPNGSVFYRTLFGCVSLQADSTNGGSSTFTVDRSLVNQYTMRFRPFMMEDYNGVFLRTTGKLIMSPAVINPTAFESIFQQFFDTLSPGYASTICRGLEVEGRQASDFSSFFKSILDHRDSLISINSLSERDMIKGLLYSKWMLTMMPLFTTGAYKGGTFDYLTVFNIVDWVNSLYPTNRTVTNRDFIRETSGFIDSTHSEIDGIITQDLTSDNQFLPIDIWGVSDSAEYSVPVADFLAFVGLLYTIPMTLQRIERVLYPTDYSFTPYSVSYPDVGEASFQVVTDAENNDSFSKFMTAVVIVAAVVVVAVTTGAISTKLLRKRAEKRETIIAQSQAKLWNGEKLTSKEWKKYRKATKKGGISSLFDAENRVSPTIQDNSGVILVSIRG